jgi:hypothetical protein
MVGRTTWTEEQHAKVVELWEAGHTAAEIGKEMGKTRNAILGHVNRRGISRNGALQSWWRKPADES